MLYFYFKLLALLRLGTEFYDHLSKLTILSIVGNYKTVLRGLFTVVHAVLTTVICELSLTNHEFMIAHDSFTHKLV